MLWVKVLQVTMKTVWNNIVRRKILGKKLTSSKDGHVVHMDSIRYSNVFAGVRTNPGPLLSCLFIFPDYYHVVPDLKGRWYQFVMIDRQW